MRIIVMGQQAFGKDVLAKLLDAGTDEVVAVYCEPDREGKPADPIKEFALKQGLPVHQPADFNDQAALDTLANFEADLMVMAFVNVFVPEAARDTPTMGSICFHPSLLPLHRGPSAVNWPIIMGATKSGYSWLYPTDPGSGVNFGPDFLTSDAGTTAVVGSVNPEWASNGDDPHLVTENIMVPVPEPSVAVLLLGGMGFLFVRRRR